MDLAIRRVSVSGLGRPDWQHMAKRWLFGCPKGQAVKVDDPSAARDGSDQGAPQSKLNSPCVGDETADANPSYLDSKAIDRDLLAAETLGAGIASFHQSFRDIVRVSAQKSRGDRAEPSVLHGSSENKASSFPKRTVPDAAIPALRRIEAKLGARPLLSRPPRTAYGRWGHTFAAIDLGTNNCRLLVARPHRTGFRVLDAFSRTVRLGEGLADSGELAPRAMDRTLSALQICADKMRKRGVTRVRAVATEACRTAMNGPNFIERAEAETGLKFDVITPKEEARLAVESCSALIDKSCESVLVFDIGGGSTELIWLDLTRKRRIGTPIPIRAWTSVPLGVVTLGEKFGLKGRREAVPNGTFDQMVHAFREAVSGFRIPTESLRAVEGGRAHLVGNSGTVTTLAGVMMKLPRYDRSKVDGAWVDLDEARQIGRDLSVRSWSDRAGHPCIGNERADLLMPGAAILEAIHSLWPCSRLRVADRGLREGVLLSLMSRADRDGAKIRRSRAQQGAEE